MTFRISAAEVLGRREEDIHLIQNADGTATDCVLRSVAIARRRSRVDEVVVLHQGTAADLDVAQVARNAAKRIAESVGGAVRVRAVLYDPGTRTTVEVDMGQRAAN